MPEDQISLQTAPHERNDEDEAERNEGRRRAGRLVQLHLHQTSRLPRLASELATHISEGSVEVYKRLKPRDPVDAMYCTTIVALQNAIISSFAEAAISRDRDEHLAQAYEGVALLMETVSVRENRRALSEDTCREDVLNELIRRYVVTPTEVD
jgi:hypothetical protein